MKNQRKLVIGLILVLLVVIFALLNTNPASINFGITKVDVPLILLIVILLLLGAGVALLIGRDDSKKISKEELDSALAKQKKSVEDVVAAKYQAKINGLESELAAAKSKIAGQAKSPIDDPDKPAD